MNRLSQFTLVAFVIALSACGADPRYRLTSPVDTTAPVRGVRVATLEVKEVSLPIYAEDSEILKEEPSGALTPIRNATWADDPARAVTLALVDRLGRDTNAAVAMEPWPLEQDAQAAVHVRVADMIARADGQLLLSGQYAVSSYDRVVRERVTRFDILVPVTASSPQGISQASGLAVSQLADRIAADLSR